jgi:hypothetical protein
MVEKLSLTTDPLRHGGTFYGFAFNDGHTFGNGVLAALLCTCGIVHDLSQSMQ